MEAFDFTLRIRLHAVDGAAAVRLLRAMLKVLWRSFGVRVLGCEPMKEKP